MHPRHSVSSTNQPTNLTARPLSHYSLWSKRLTDCAKDLERQIRPQIMRSRRRVSSDTWALVDCSSGLGYVCVVKVHEAPLRSVCSTPFRGVSISAQLDHGRVTLVRIHVPMYYDDVSCPE